MRVLPDTNVLVAAQLWPNGVCGRLFESLLDDSRHEVVLSEFVLGETKRILTRKFSVPETRVADIEARLRKNRIVSADLAEFTLPEVRDPDDVWVLVSALVAQADVLVTGDRDLLDVADRVEGLEILTPRALWERMQEDTGG